MLAICPPLEEARPVAGTQQRWYARLELGFEAPGDGRTVLAHRLHKGPLRVQKALYPEGPEVCHALILHPPAGIAGGDELTLQVTVGEGAKALITTPGAGKWYRSNGPLARQTLDFEVAAGGVLEWLPQESIVFDRVKGHTETRVRLAGDAVFIGLDLLCLGRTASGERFTEGSLRLASRIERDGKLIWSEQGLIEGGSRLLESPIGLCGQPVTGTLLVASESIDASLLAACREIRPTVGEGAVTRLPGLLVARYLGPSGEPARAWFVALWAALRPALAGRAASVPRIWHT
ncbi:urease accessory protein UreD [Zoogloea sp.]|uniref:urease accessory protein UreD n=1 Tax=Zoogloea sp. TaxID=49181 RepID=UPI00258F9AB4|nr:urease accessory protein UreD [Zoogloea sp.]